MAAVFTGLGSPEGILKAVIGSLYLQQDGASGNVVWIKETGNGTNTGWVLDEAFLGVRGVGSPENVVSATVGTMFQQTDAVAGVYPLWYKKSGSGSTGWVQFPDFPTIIMAHQFSGADAGAKIKAAIDSLTSAGGIVDCRGFSGAQTIGVNVFGGYTGERPLELIFGDATFTVSVGQWFPGKVRFILNGTKFVLADGTAAITMFEATPRVGLSNASVTNGSPTATINAEFSQGIIPEKDRAVSFEGHLPSNGARDNTTLNGAIDAVVTTITVVSTTGFPTTGTLKIDSELITYTGTTATTFTGLTRGALGTTAASHANAAAVDRVVRESYLITKVTGAAAPYTVTLDRNFAGTTGTAVGCLMGPSDVVFEGHGTLDGNKPASDSANNAGGIIFAYGTRCKVGRNIAIRGFDHIGCMSQHCQDNVIDGQYYDNGWDTGLGAHVWLFTGDRNCTVLGDYVAGGAHIVIDDRTTTGQPVDNACVGCVALPRTMRRVRTGLHIEGAIGCYGRLPFVENWTSSALTITHAQWITAPTVKGNVVELGYVTPTGAAVVFGSTGVTDNFVTSWTPGITAGGAFNGNYLRYVDSSKQIVTPVGYTHQWQDAVTVSRTYSTDAGAQQITALVAPDWTVVQTGGFRIGLQVHGKTSHTSGTQVQTIAVRTFAWAAGSGGTTSTLTSVFAEGSVDTGATVTNYQGLRIVNPGGTGTITSLVGIIIDAMSRGTANNIGIDIGAITGTNAIAIRTNSGLVQLGDKVRLNSVAGLICANAALATTATAGFVYIPSMAGVPTGTPAAETGTVAMVYDTTNNKIMVYNGAWRGVVLA